MSTLISGKEAWLAKSEGKSVQYKLGFNKWCDLNDDEFLYWQTERFLSDERGYTFRLKPESIIINDIKVPAPFKPTCDCVVWILDDSKTCNYRSYHYELDGDQDNRFIGMWRTEDEIEQVVEALKQVLTYE